MAVIYCGKSNTVPYYIREADINIYSIQELAYYIYNYALLIPNSFISKSLIVYIERNLNLPKLSEALNEMYNKGANLSDMLILLLSNSNYYSDEEVAQFRTRILSLLNLPELDYINLAGDKLFFLQKYEKAINQYIKIYKKDDNALLKLAFCYAKLQFYETAAGYLKELYKRTKSHEVLKIAYYTLKLNGTVDNIYEFEPDIKEELLAEWEYDIVSNIIFVRKSEAVKEMEDIFLMGTTHIKQNIGNLIKIWKEKYRYIG